MIDERETIIRFGSEGGPVWVWTNIPAHARRLIRRGHKPTSIGRDAKTKAEVSWRFDLPERVPMSIFWPARRQAQVRLTSKGTGL